jgi:hypothetical protein
MASCLVSDELPHPFKELLMGLEENQSQNAYNAFTKELQRINDGRNTLNPVDYKVESQHIIVEIAKKIAEKTTPNEEMAVKAVISYCLYICLGVFCNYDKRFVVSPVDFTVEIKINNTGLQKSAFVNFQHHDPEISKIKYEYYEFSCNETFKIYKKFTKVQKDTNNIKSGYYDSYIVIFNTPELNTFAIFDTHFHYYCDL